MRERWWLAILVLLLAAALGATGLNADAYSADEVSSLIVAGGGPYGPFTPVQAWQRVAENSPDQALGWALLLSVWGQIAGWSELATRALPFFIGLLALAWVYRAGRDLFSPRAGLAAAAILATAILFIPYLHKLRVFTLIALVVSLTLWSYWRIALHPRPGGWAARLGFVAGGIGLFYTHYFATPLLGAIGLYHLLLVPKTRRWWGPVLLGLVALAAFLPEVQVLLAGLQRNLGNDALRASAMTVVEVAQSVLFYFSNGQVILPVALAITLAALAVRHRTRFDPNLVYVIFSALALLALMMVENEIVGVMAPNRVRYLMPLWPLLALLTGASIAAIGAHWRWWALALVSAWMVAGLWAYFASDLRYEVDGQPLPPWRELRAVLQSQGSASDDVFVFHGLPTRTREYYGAATIPMRREIIETQDTIGDLEAFVRDAQRVWLGTDWRIVPGFPSDWSQSENYQRFQAILSRDFVHCAQFIHDPVMHLDLYARSTAFCPHDAAIMRFGDGIALTGADISHSPSGDVQLAMGWTIAPNVPSDTYSVAVHVVDAQAETLVTQADFGLPPDPFAPVQIGIPLDDLPAGDYRVMIGVYAWQSGDRLQGVDLRDLVTGDLLLLDTFRVSER